MSAFTTGDWVGVAQLVLFAGTGYLALRASRLPRRWTHLIVTVGLAGSAAAIGLTITRPSGAAVAGASIWTGLLLLATVVVIVRRILSFSTVTMQSIYGAVSAYLILGLMFAAFYAAIHLLHGGPFFADNQPANSRTYQYFSFTTLTTLGYGDFTATGHGGQAIAVMEAVTGQIFLATLVARLVAAFRTQAAPPAAPRGRRRPSDRPAAPPPRPARPAYPGRTPYPGRPGRRPTARLPAGRRAAGQLPAGQASAGQGSAGQGSTGPRPTAQGPASGGLTPPTPSRESRRRGSNTDDEED
jgi:Ion channel